MSANKHPDSCGEEILKELNNTGVLSKEFKDRLKALVRRYVPGIITMQTLATEYGISDSAVEFIIKRKTWA